MRKIASLILFAFLYLFLSQSLVLAISVPTIGSLAPGETKEITVSGLIPNEKYQWIELRLTGSFPSQTYAEVYSSCYTANSDGNIADKIGPFTLAGFYKLTIHETYVGKDCLRAREVASQDFSVGGGTNQACCQPFHRYDRNRDLCLKDLVLSEPSYPTECSKSGLYCEPLSLKCFQRVTNTTNCSKEDIKSNKCTRSGGNPCPVNDAEALQPDLYHTGIQTAIGCVPTKPAELIKAAFNLSVGIGGGIAFLLMVFGAFEMVTSNGNPDALKNGQDRFKAAIIGILFIIFSVILLRIIGVDVLGLDSLI